MRFKVVGMSWLPFLLILSGVDRRRQNFSFRVPTHSPPQQCLQISCDGPSIVRTKKLSLRSFSDGARSHSNRVIRFARVEPRRVRSRCFTVTPEELWPRDAQPARRGRMFQRVPDCTLLEIGKERGQGGGVSAKPLAQPRLVRRSSRTSSYLSIG